MTEESEHTFSDDVGGIWYRENDSVYTREKSGRVLRVRRAGSGIEGCNAKTLRWEALIYDDVSGGVFYKCAQDALNALIPLHSEAPKTNLRDHIKYPPSGWWNPRR